MPADEMFTENLREQLHDAVRGLEPSPALLAGLETRYRRVPLLPGTGLRSRPLAALLGTTGVAGATVASILVFTAGGAPSAAFAAWTANPTTPANGQVQAAESICASSNAAPASPASLTPTVTDTRGPYTALLYAQSNTISGCITGPGTDASAAPVVVGGVSSQPGTAKTDASPVAAGTISWWQAGLSEDGPPQTPISLVDGQVGAGVTAVTLELQDGSSVQTTIANGWFIAWWPSNQPIKTTKVSTANGTTTQSAPRIGLGPARLREALTHAQATPGPDGTIVKSAPATTPEASQQP